MPGKNDGHLLRRRLCESLNISNFKEYLLTLYAEGLSGPEIAEKIERDTGIIISPRSIQRTLQRLGVMRPVKEAFALAMKRGRVVWQLEEDKARREKARYQLPRGLRFKILERDNFTCQLCGAGRTQGALLQVDHIVARVDGGEDEDENLRTLCLTCNLGKREAHKESGYGGGFMSAS